MDDYVDMIILCGGVGLYKMCKENSIVLVIIGGFGISYIFVDESVDLDKFVVVIENVKVQCLLVCNVLDILLVY